VQPPLVRTDGYQDSEAQRGARERLKACTAEQQLVHSAAAASRSVISQRLPGVSQLCNFQVIQASLGFAASAGGLSVSPLATNQQYAYALLRSFCSWIRLVSVVLLPGHSGCSYCLSSSSFLFYAGICADELQDDDYWPRTQALPAAPVKTCVPPATMSLVSTWSEQGCTCMCVCLRTCMVGCTV
jgi:hypothetical protein